MWSTILHTAINFHKKESNFTMLGSVHKTTKESKWTTNTHLQLQRLSEEFSPAITYSFRLLVTLDLDLRPVLKLLKVAPPFFIQGFGFLGNGFIRMSAQLEHCMAWKEKAMQPFTELKRKESAYCIWCGCNIEGQVHHVLQVLLNIAVLFCCFVSSLCWTLYHKPLL